MLINNKYTLMGLFAVSIFILSVGFGAASTLGQQTFDSPDLAAEAFVEAVATDDDQALASILGKNWKNFIPTDNISQEDVDAFISAWDQTHRFKPLAYGRVQLAVGPKDWTLPIPIVKEGDRWRFDTIAGAEEMRTRRIGRDELATMQAVLAYYDAQKEYALADRNGDGIFEYAQRLVSTPGKRNGLYWPVTAGEEESPLGPLFGKDEPGKGYNGYYYRILTGQGTNAPGGAYNYKISGRMSAGFGLVAWPVRYDDTGVMTFVVSHDGKVFQKDLGPDTDAEARGMTLFDPDASWEEVTPE